MAGDTLYRDAQRELHDFDFGAATAAVFDDMLARSIPLYAEIQRMIAEIASAYAMPGSRVFDLGCSTGTTLLNIDRALGPDISLVGIDSSHDMLEKAACRFAEIGLSHPVELICHDLALDTDIRNASVVVMAWTLQFVRPLHRERLIRDIAKGLEPGGCLILVEKVLSCESRLSRFFIQRHQDFKRDKGYSELEISQKREALENILIPYQEHENKQMLLRNGFTHCDGFFRWYNFSGILGVK